MREPSSAAVASRGRAAGLADALRRRVVIEQIAPSIDHGRFPIKRTIDESVDVTADVFADGHDVDVFVGKGQFDDALDRDAVIGKEQGVRHLGTIGANRGRM